MTDPQNDAVNATGDEELVEEDDTIIRVALMWSLGVIVLVGAGIGIAVWQLRQPEKVAVTEPETPEKLIERKFSEVDPPRVPFTDVTQEAGIDFIHTNGAAGEKLLPETMGGGCAFFDYDNDGDPDLFLVNSNHWPWTPSSGPEPTMALYRNDGNGHFEDVTVQAGLDVSLYGMGVATGDFDNDGNVDLFISALGSNRLFRNTGGKFVDVTEKSGTAGADDAWSTSCGWFDYDNDGDLDLFVANYLIWSREFDLAQNFQLTGGGRAYGRPQVFGGTFPYLYRNEGNGTFTEVAKDAGLHVNYPATGVPAAKSLGVTFVDFDGDGYLDVFVANDTVQNFLFHNRANGTFEEVAAVSGVAFDERGNARGAMGIDAQRFRNDASIGIAIGNFANEATALYVAESSDMQFIDEAVSNGLGPSTRLDLTFGVFFFDADLDGRLDLFTANGHLEEDISRVRENETYEQPPQLFWNCGPDAATEFMPLRAESVGEDFRRPLVGRGATYADIDGDGDLDILIAATGRRPRLLRNDQDLDRHWLQVRLQGKTVNRDAIGAWVELATSEGVQRRHVMPTRSYISQTWLPVTFGLGEATEVERLTVHWPNGQEQQVPVEGIDRRIEIEQQ